MRVLPTRLHGIVDYLWGALLIASPWLFGFAADGVARWVALAFGVVAILYSLLTDYELGAMRIIPMPVHLGLDLVAGLALAASPWLLGFAGQVFWPHLLFGLFAVGASLFTQARPAPSRRATTETA